MPTLTTFASGANEPSEILGFSIAGHSVGASASLLRPAAVQALSSCAGPVFVDSGAFSEVSYSAEYRQLQVVAPISPKEWRRRLAIYLTLARCFGARLTVVAPDRVGDQCETLRRISQYREELGQLAALGVTVLIPLQLGQLTHEIFYKAAKEAAGIALTPAFTMKKGTTSLSAAREFLAAVKPTRIHLLGMGINNHRAGEFLDMIHGTSPDTDISMDSNRLRAVTGKGRPLTVAEHEFRASETEDINGHVTSPILAATGRCIDYTDSISRPSLWASQQMIGQVAVSAGLSLSEIHSFLGEPDSFLTRIIPASDIAYYEHPLISLALDHAWSEYVENVTASLVRSAAIVQTFSNEAEMLQSTSTGAHTQ